MLSLLLIAAIVLSHPISPLFLGIYLFAVLLVTMVFRENLLKHAMDFFSRITLISKSKISSDTKNILRFTVLLLFLCSFWFFWTIYQASPNYEGVQAPISKVLDLSFLRNLDIALQWTTGGQGFLYPQISQLSLFIYAIFLISILAVFFASLFKFFRYRGPVGQSTTLLILTLTAIGSGVMSYLLFSSSGERFLLGRGLIFFLLMGSICISAYLVEPNAKKTRIKTTVASMFILFLVCSFPLIAYSKEASILTPSVGGLVFLSENIDLSERTLSMTNDRQLLHTLI